MISLCTKSEVPSFTCSEMSNVSLNFFLVLLFEVILANLVVVVIVMVVLVVVGLLFILHCVRCCFCQRNT